MIVAVFSSQPKSMLTAEKSVESIFRQTRVPDRVIWFLPRVSKRFKMDYPDVPEWVAKYPKLEVIRCTDYGPSTKIAPLLDMPEIKAEDKVIIFDDDTQYKPNCVELLVKATEGKTIGAGFFAHTYRYKPFQLSAKHIQGDPDIQERNRVSVILASSMVIYPRSVFPASSKDIEELYTRKPHLFLNDDHIYSLYAYKKNVALYHLPYPDGMPLENSLIVDGRLTGTNSTRNAAITMMMSGDMSFPTAEFIIVMVVFLVVIVLLFFAYRYFRNKKSAPKLFERQHSKQ